MKGDWKISLFLTDLKFAIQRFASPVEIFYLSANLKKKGKKIENHWSSKIVFYQITDSKSAKLGGSMWADFMQKSSYHMHQTSYSLDAQLLWAIAEKCYNIFKPEVLVLSILNLSLNTVWIGTKWIIGIISSITCWDINTFTINRN